mgnify:CR=1 FL=1|jgi:hypothetical protein|tara:strand:- start:135 stop:692 length:558 start_codon:yes stop_codon:yes gene_type:complete
MKHYYKTVEGWFNYEWFYDDAVTLCEDGETIVEIGAYKGKSACYAGVAMANTEKVINLHSVDHFKGSPAMNTKSNPVYVPQLKGDCEYLYKEFLKNTKPVSEWVRGIKLDSASASTLYEDESLAGVFIDGDHTYKGCLADIKNWLPKIKKGGMFAGHDYNFSGVKKAVSEFFDTIELRGNCWNII